MQETGSGERVTAQVSIRYWVTIYTGDEVATDDGFHLESKSAVIGRKDHTTSINQSNRDATESTPQYRPDVWWWGPLCRDAE